MYEACRGFAMKMLPHISNHILRHTLCTILCKNTSDLKFVMSVMGHANKEIALGIYYHIHEKNLTDNFEKFSKNARIIKLISRKYGTG